MAAEVGQLGVDELKTEMKNTGCDVRDSRFLGMPCRRLSDSRASLPH